MPFSSAPFCLYLQFRNTTTRWQWWVTQSFSLSQKPTIPKIKMVDLQLESFHTLTVGSLLVQAPTSHIRAPGFNTYSSWLQLPVRDDPKKDSSSTYIPATQASGLPTAVGHSKHLGKEQWIADLLLSASLPLPPPLPHPPFSPCVSDKPNI